MKAQTALLPTQPATHANSPSHWRQWLLCQNYSLTIDQIQKFNPLRLQSNILFQQNQRWDLITSLYTQYFQQPGKKSGKQWMKLGFQGQYPETDFRGGGVLSLQLIYRFVKRNKLLVKQMQKDPGQFFFAITAINIAFFMKQYFHLADHLQAPRDSQIYCNRRALKNFCRILIDNEQAYIQMHEIFLIYFYTKIWKNNNGNSLLNFNNLFAQLKHIIRLLFEDRDLVTYGDFKRAFNLLTN